MTARLLGTCNGCGQQRECETRYGEHFGRFLCDRCANVPVKPVKLTVVQEDDEPTDRTEARLKALGIAAAIGTPFPCVIPGHRHEACLHRAFPGGPFDYCCDGAGRYKLGSVRAYIAHGAQVPISDVLGARWSERLDHEAGLLEPRPFSFSADLPDLQGSGLRVVQGFALLVALRDRDDAIGWGDDPFWFSRDFAAAWCGVSREAARHGIRVAERVGVMERSGTAAPKQRGKYRPAVLWRPGPALSVEMAEERAA